MTPHPVRCVAGPIPFMPAHMMQALNGLLAELEAKASALMDAEARFAELQVRRGRGTRPLPAPVYERSGAEPPYCIPFDKI
jgi:hypothetical protein